MSKLLTPELKARRLTNASERAMRTLAKRCAAAVIYDPRGESPWQEASKKERNAQQSIQQRLLPGSEREQRPFLPGTDLKILALTARQQKDSKHHSASVRLWRDVASYPRHYDVAVASGDYFPTAAGVAGKDGFFFRLQPNNFIDIDVLPPEKAWREAGARLKRVELSAAAVVALSVSTCTGANFDPELERMAKLHNKWSVFLGEESVVEASELWEATPPSEIQALLAQPVLQPHDAIA